MGLIVLAGAAAAIDKTRTYEAGILKALGVPRRKILISFVLRSLLIGAGTSVFAIFLAGFASWTILIFLLDTKYSLDLKSVLLVIILGILTNLIAGLFFARNPLSASVSKILNNEN